MEHLPGYLVIGITVTTISALFIWRWLAWKKKQPTEYHRGVGMIYLEDAIKPWKNWRDCIDAVLHTAARHPELGKAHKPRFWVEVVPYHRPLLNKNIVTGWVHKDRPYGPTAPPKTVEEAEQCRRVVGSVRVARMMPLFPKHYVIQLVQIRAEDSKLEGRMMTGVGDTLAMEHSAFFYEFAKRLVDFMNSGGKYMGEIQVIEEDEVALEKEINATFTWLQTGEPT
jgi:hypothetical protein